MTRGREAQTARVPKQLLTAMKFGDAARAAMRIAVDSDAPVPILFAAQILIDACLETDSDGRAAFEAGFKSWIANPKWSA